MNGREVQEADQSDSENEDNREEQQRLQQQRAELSPINKQLLFNPIFPNPLFQEVSIITLENEDAHKIKPNFKSIDLRLLCLITTSPQDTEHIFC